MELAADPGEAGHRRVHVAVPEPRRDRPTAQLDDTGGAAYQRTDVAVPAHGDDAAAADGEGLSPGLRGVGGEDPSPGQDEVGGVVVRHGAEDDSPDPTVARHVSRGGAQDRHTLPFRGV